MLLSIAEINEARKNFREVKEGENYEGIYPRINEYEKEIPYEDPPLKVYIPKE